jgi:hypothetical protein
MSRESHISELPHVVVTTESGSTYEFRGETVRRFSAEEPENILRGDNVWLRYARMGEPTVGLGMRLILEPLSGASVVTFRTTSPVTSITEA